MKNFLAALVALALIAGGAWFWWTTTPDYALKQAAEAARTHDVANFEYWVDTDHFSYQAVEDLLATPVRATGSGILSRLLGIGILTLLHEPVAHAMKDQIVEYVRQDPQAEGASREEGSEHHGGFMEKIVSLVKPPSLGKMLKELGFTKENYRGVKYMHVKDNKAAAGLAFFIPSADKDVIVEFGLARVNNQWKLREISNLAELSRIMAQP